jgi:gamma-glutamyltranspeptidase/glutathione hydrolase
MNAQAAVDAGRIHHQWLPDKLFYEKGSFSPDTLRLLEARGHLLDARDRLGAAEVIVVNAAEGLLEAGVDRRVPDGGARGN